MAKAVKNYQVAMNVKEIGVLPHPPDKAHPKSSKKSDSSSVKARSTSSSIGRLTNGSGHRLRENPSPKDYGKPLSQPRSKSSKKTPPLSSPVRGTAVERSKSRDSFSKYNCLPSIKTSSNEQSEIQNVSSPSKTVESGFRKRGRTYGDTFALSDQMESMHINDSKRPKSNENTTTSDEVEIVQKEVCQKSLEDVDESITLAIRLPKGTRMEETFKGSSQLKDILSHISKKWRRDIGFKEYAIYTNEVPKRELRKPKSTLKDLGIVNKSVLVIEKRE